MKKLKIRYLSSYTNTRYDTRLVPMGDLNPLLEQLQKTQEKQLSNPTIDPFIFLPASKFGFKYSQLVDFYEIIENPQPVINKPVVEQPKTGLITYIKNIFKG